MKKGSFNVKMVKANQSVQAALEVANKAEVDVVGTCI